MFKSLDSRLIGEILQQADLVSKAQIEVALLDQKRYQDLELGHLKIGDIFALRGWIKQETTDFFVQRWKTLLTQEEKQPLGYYLRQAALLDEQQISYLLAEQQKSKRKLRLGELAYLQGWLKLKTVNYFVENLSPKLSNSKELTTCSFSSLEGAVLKEVNLDCSSLKQLNLNQGCKLHGR